MSALNLNLPSIDHGEVVKDQISIEDIDKMLEEGNYEDLEEGDEPIPEPDSPVEEELSPEPETSEEDSFEQFEEEENIAGLAEFLYKEKSIIIPDDFDGEVDRNDLKNLIDLRVEREKDTVRKETQEYTQKAILNKMNPVVQDLVSYQLENPNLDGNDILEYAASLQGVNRINSLNPETHADVIIREYYKAIQLPGDEIEDMIETLSNTEGKLQAKAVKLKPELDKIAQSVVSKKVEKEKLVREYDEQLQATLHNDTVKVLNKGELFGVKLSEADSQYLYSVIMNNETVVTIKGNKKVEMGELEARIMKAKYDPSENKENLMMAALVLRDGLNGIKKYLEKEVTNKEVEKFQKEIKFRNKKKTNIRQTSSPQKELSGVQLTF